MKKAYQLIEELMLLANETVAKWLVDRQIPTIFRVHAPPDETKLARLGTLCEELGVPFDVESAQDPKKLSALLKEFADHPQAQVLNMLLLRSMKQATPMPPRTCHPTPTTRDGCYRRSLRVRTASGGET